MARAVILGGSGFIGRWITRSLAKNNYQVTVIDLEAPPESADWVKADATDADKVAAEVGRGDVVIHLVHSSIPVESMVDPAAELKQNVIPYVELVERISDRAPRLFVYSSTGGQIYGDVERVPISENAATCPVSAYGASKLAMEQFTRLANLRRGLPYLIIRIGNPYGPYQELTNRHGVIPYLFRSVIHGNQFTLFGGGVTVRDYVYIEDAAEAVARLIESGAKNTIVNIGSGRGTSLIDLIRLVEKISGGKVNIREEPIRASDVMTNYLDISRLKELTGFSPEVSLEDGLQSTWEYMRANEEA
jgi:UDP-glucose 4-epimerase